MTCSTCANRSSASERRRPAAACVSTRARRPEPGPGAPRAAPGAVAERHASASAAEPELDFIHGLDSVHELDAMPRTRRFERPAREGEAAPRRRRFERSARDERDERSGTESDAKPRTRRFERSPERRGRLARGEHDARLDLAPEAPASAAPAPLAAPSRRRTVEITGRTVGAPSLPRLVQIARRCPARRATERVGARPDRLALWAVVLGFFLIFVAVTSTSHAATRAHSAGAASGRVVHHQLSHAHTAALRACPPAR